MPVLVEDVAEAVAFVDVEADGGVRVGCQNCAYSL